MKSLDKKKTKELEWYKVLTTCDGYGLVGCGSYIVDNELRCGGCGKVRYEVEKEVIMIKKNVEDALTQQRTELLEEINKLPDLTTTEFGEETISRLEVINLVKK